MISKQWKETLRRLGLGSLAALMLMSCIQTTNVTTLNVRAEENVSDTEEEKDSDADDEEEDTKESDASKESDDKKEPEVSDDYYEQSLNEETRVGSTSEFLVVGDCAPTVTGRYGQPVHLILPIYNMGVEMVTNLIVTPVISTKVDEWPFQITTTGLVQAVDNVPASPNKEIAYQNRREVEWDLIVSKDAPPGYYPLDFNVPNISRIICSCQSISSKGCLAHVPLVWHKHSMKPTA